MAGRYSDCYFCGGMLVEERVTREIRWQGELFLIENVPVGVCQQCGEKVILPAIARTIDAMLSGEKSPDGFVQVPTFRFRETESVA
jgi:YgiT-type zinc finger domain-containing protein